MVHPLEDEERVVDEETALLTQSHERRKPTPLPWLQISIVLLLQVTEPITSMSIYPYINQLVSELDIIGGDERKVGYYAGLIFYAGVLKSVMGELTDSTNRAEGFAFMPVVWATGATLGPLMGGTLSKPAERFPYMFGGRFWKEYPYFLPCLATSAFVFLAFVITLTVPKSPTRKLSGSAEGSYHDDPIPLSKVLVYPVILSVSNYMSLAFLHISLNALLPLFLAMPLAIGGLGFDPVTIGYVMGIYGCIFMFITASTPSKRTLGATNGLSQTAVSIVRAVGPAMVTSLFAVSAEHYILWGYAVYVIFFVFSCFAILLALRLPHQMWEEADT
ncbi:hypothetical protein C0995_008004 [Termitomyces sp. Mi166|nr:hypothetical protein C0995_008004 [Termitomyces sp. Mi166\